MNTEHAVWEFHKKPVYEVFKRLFDLVVSLVLVILLALGAGFFHFVWAKQPKADDGGLGARKKGCSTILIWFFVRDITPVVQTGSRAAYQRARDGESIFSILRRNPTILLYLAVSALCSAAYDQYGYLMPLDLGRIHGENGAVIYGTVSSLNCIVVVLFTPLLTRLFRRMIDTKKLLTGKLLFLAGYILFLAFLGTIPMYYAAMLIFTWGEIINTIADGPYLSARTPASHRGRINSVSGVAYT